LEWVIADVAESASGIDRQQVALGRWARSHLAAASLLGVNDTGAIAYFSDRSTFDIVGLTTRDEARYWVAGVGSRLEHYEKIYARRRSDLPSHFAVYREWMAMDFVLKNPLLETTVTDSTILGGQTMGIYPADWSKLGTGERPWSSDAPILDELDVADLESEASHDYELSGARAGEQVAREGRSPEDATVVDGGRTHRTLERFVAHLPQATGARGIMRLEGPSGTSVHILGDGQQIGGFELDRSDMDWMERSFEIPAGVSGPRTRIEVRTVGGALTVFHYWFVQTS
jgi:hypothetical protein